MNEFVGGALYTIIAYGTPLILCSLGGLMTGLSGRFNLGMEGMMLFSAFFSLYFANLFNNLILGLVIGVLITILIGLFMAFMCLKFDVDIYIVGMAINTLGTGLTTFLIFLLTGAQGSIIYPDAPRLENLTTPIISEIPYLNQILSNHTVLDYLTIVLVVVMYAVIFKTAYGRRLRAVGMSEWVASARGISVDKMIYSSYALCGLFCGLAVAEAGHIWLLRQGEVGDAGALAQNPDGRVALGGQLLVDNQIGGGAVGQHIGGHGPHWGGDHL